ncbi:MAG: N-acetylglucosamine-6-phosphate deacetylase, partial [Paracoccaceae bacterium]|nr:N-acetylglucosamine-6-phosphate deacetylase [Paracoccaceae bacterium]
AIARGLPGIVGLHLEGPHLSLARKGAHDPALIRPMQGEDVKFLAATAQRLPVLMVTLAPESVTPAQIRALAEAGVVVSLGHSDAGFDACKAAAGHGARCVTHIFNAMSQLGSREPGLVGAALAHGELSAGLIADMIHVHPESIAAAFRAKRGPGRIFLVSDAMATAGSEVDHFVLNGRRIERSRGRLTLADGTLAGADLQLTTAIRNMVEHVGLPLAEALAMATSIPAGLIGQADRMGCFAAGAAADFIWLDAGFGLAGVWRKGRAAAG